MKPNTNIRLDYLDALRGIAALMVVVYHYINWHWSDRMMTQVATLFFNGRSAVSFFFVLSGFVLAYKYFNYGTKLQPGRFIFRRFFRLYPAYVVTVAINWATWVYAPTFSETIDKILRLNYGPVFAELSMILYEHSYYVPGWSLGVEMRISLLVPFIIMLARWRTIGLWSLLFLSIFLQPPYITINIFHFFCGILIAYYYESLSKWEWTKSRLYTYRYGLYLFLFLLFNLRVFNHLFPFPTTYLNIADQLGIDWPHYAALASAGIILLAIWRTDWQQQLIHPWLLHLGKLSYGIYLSHWVWVVLVMQSYEDLIALTGLPEWMGFGLYLLLTIIGTLLLAQVLYQYVEKPMMRWAKKVW